MNRQLNDVGTVSDGPVANFPGVGYMSSEASSTASWAANTSTYFDLHGTVYSTAVTGASAYDGTYYTSTAVAVGSAYFTLDFDGTATMTLSDVLLNTVGPHPTAQLTYYLDSTVYTAPSTVALSAGMHHMQIFAYDSGTSGSYSSPFGFETYGTYSGGVSGATYDFQVTSSVPEPASLAALFCGVVGLVKRRRKG